MRSIIFENLPQIYFLALLLCLSVFVIYAVFIGPFNIKITKNTFDLFDDSSSTIKIVLISDIENARYYSEYFQRVIEAINSQNADLILIGGDTIGNGKMLVAEDFSNGKIDWGELEHLKNLKSKHGLYAVLGNHDYDCDHTRGDCKNKGNDLYADKVEKKLKKLGIEVLRNEHRILKIKDRCFALIGIDDYWAHKSDYKKAAAGVPYGLPKVILSHNQFSVRGEKLKGRNLVLSGHTHWGRVRLPFITDYLLKLLGVADFNGGRFVLGENTELYVTSGIAPGDARFLAPPEISVLYLD